MIIIAAPVHDSFLQTLEKKNLSYHYQPNIKADMLSPLLPEAEGLVVSTHLAVDRQLIDAAVNLQWIGRLGSGMEHIDVKYASLKGIRCISSPEGNSNAVAEMALGSLLNILRNIAKSNNEVKSGIWKREENRGVEISGKTIGIIGFGNTGSRFAQLLSSFGCRILVYDKYKNDIGLQHVEVVAFNEILEKADVVSLHLPLNDETYHMFNAALFDMLKKKPVLVNTSRGGIIDTNALIQSLQIGRVSGAVLDVLENEKLSKLNKEEQEQLDFLNQHPAVFITPHIAGYTQESFIRLGTVLLEKLGIT